jgi:hypothetical protein
MAIAVSKAVYDGILAVRDSGKTNMLDRPRVVELLQEMEFDDAAEWVEQNRKEYSHGIFQGFQAVENAESSQGDEA